ncbi:MAG: class I SAM-dependent methyltransferase, partial [Magnetovibrio sp.]|nr:class I SAM-dependent methyltransferase [Magnetovibrio sp.]
VLDIGCGTGLWSFMAAEQVGLHGKVIGIDPNPDSIAIANERRNSHYLKSVIKFKKSDIKEAVKSLCDFDVVLMFNVLSYFDKPEDLLAQCLSFLKPGSRLILKDSDLQSDQFWPDNDYLHEQILKETSTKTHVKIGGGYDPFFAQKIPGILKKFSTIRVSTISQSIILAHPFTHQERNYIRSNALTLADIAWKNGARKNGARKNGNKWASLFSAKSPDCIFENSEFAYSTTEFAFQIIVG